MWCDGVKWFSPEFSTPVRMLSAEERMSRVVRKDKKMVLFLFLDDMVEFQSLI